MTEESKLAFDYASKGVSHLITLATGVITLSVTFGKDVFKTESPTAKKMLFVAWFFFIASIFCGVFTHYKIAGTLAVAKPGDASIYDLGLRLLSVFQLIFFSLGTIFSVVFGIVCLRNPAPKVAL